MSIISAHGISKEYGANTVFANVSFRIEKKEKIGIVGVNGAGKTTLFRLIVGEEYPDSGDIVRDKDITLAYMRQHSDLTSDKTAVEEVLSVFGKQIEIENEIERVTALLQTEENGRLFERLNRLNEEFDVIGGRTFRSKTRSALIGLGLSEQEISLPLSSLSGGQRTRVLLAKVLLSDAGVLLLDEPTNHLDISATEWLESFLQSYSGSVVVISHDRFFLDRICGKIFELENKKLTVYGGNYTYYRNKKAEDKLALTRDYEQKRREINRIEKIIEQQKRFNRERNYITIRSKQKQIERIEKTVEKPETEPDEIHFHFHACSETANEVLVLKSISKSFGDRSLFSHADLLVKKKEKVFLVGENGCGKTTLLRIILGQLEADTGQIVLGSRVKPGYYDQALSDLCESNTVFEEISDAYPGMKNGEIRSALASFLFCGDDVYKKISVLSGGEKARVLLAKLMLSQTNFLILDEPTNHLDSASRDALERVLREYDGTLLIVSHDRYFINRLADKIAVIAGGEICVYAGNYEQYLEKKNNGNRKETIKYEKSGSDYEKKKFEASEKRKRQTRLKRIEENIEKCEQRLRELSEQMNDPSFASDYSKITEIAVFAEEEQKKLDELYKEWEEVMRNEE